MISNDCRCPGCGTCSAADEITPIKKTNAELRKKLREERQRYAELERMMHSYIKHLHAAERERDEASALAAKVADTWRAEVEEVENERNARAREADKLRAERRQLRRRLVECRPWVGACPYPNTPGFDEVMAIRGLADDTLAEVSE
jgi:hypothetical protein